MSWIVLTLFNFKVYPKVLIWSEPIDVKFLQFKPFLTVIGLNCTRLHLKEEKVIFYKLHLCAKEVKKNKTQGKISFKLILLWVLETRIFNRAGLVGCLLHLVSKQAEIQDNQETQQWNDVSRLNIIVFDVD